MGINQFTTMKKVTSAIVATLAILFIFNLDTQAQGLDEQVQALTQKLAELEKAQKKDKQNLQNQVSTAQTRADDAWHYADLVDDSVRKVKEVLSLVAENAATSKQQLQSLDEIAAKLYPQKPIKDTAGKIVSEPKTTFKEAVVLQDQKIKSKVGMLLFLVTTVGILTLMLLSHRAKRKALAAQPVTIPNPASAANMAHPHTVN